MGAGLEPGQSLTSEAKMQAPRSATDRVDIDSPLRPDRGRDDTRSL
jgi:hypothetical protein